ncbi:MAG TPA: NADH-quinone oxidoreductase subunit L [Ignavibacteria bacterium]|nr:NADH-quinone oxidoreductase subunit L [Ignavibacteria bacterium]HQY51449.1 NADH-quinone oxidoreductase subunit L [Ignavibacteria bacterium]
MENFYYTLIIPVILFFTFVFTGLLGRKFKPLFSGMVCTASIFISTALSWYTAYQYFFVQGKVDGAYKLINVFNLEWLRFNETLSIDIGILLDPISVMMLVVITTVSLMVHLYSLGYMKGDPGFSRYYAFLSLFTFSMLGLVLSVNIFMTYMFWELVGVSSYLLIGHYYDKPSAVSASKKAFIVTRFADLGFLIGILLLSAYAGSFDFNELTNPQGSAILQSASVTFMGLSAVTWALILIFIGCAGKSAMFPLHIWLPDAMEGPTPVSALIHAATMVVAGVYLIARLFPLYIFTSPQALEVVAYVGAFTSLFAAVIACTQTDIKRVLAFSTISQIGYMMVALGVSGYGGEEGLGYMASMFHLFTHAMFKALLFLGAGSIIHAIHTNEICDMGNLRKYMPVTHITFLIACLAIAGIPPLSGFFSKDEILVAVIEKNFFLFIVQYIVAGLTAFYMFRLYFIVFWNKEKKYEHEPHESPSIMLITLVFLAVCSAVAGFIPFSEFVTSDGLPFVTHIHMKVAVPTVTLAVIGILTAFFLYKKESTSPDKIKISLGLIYRSAYRKFYIDEVYMFVTKKIIFNMISVPIAWFDRNVIDSSMNGIAAATNFISEKIKYLQSGQLQQYAFVMVAGMILIFLLTVYLITL